MSHDSSGCADACSAACPCSRCDLLLGLDGVHVEDVDRRDGLLIVTVSSPAAPTARRAGSSRPAADVADGCFMMCPA